MTTQEKRRKLGARPCRKCGEVFKGVRCMPCTRKKNREWYYSKAGRTWYKTTQRRQQRHGLTMMEADELIKSQGGLCKVCRKPPTGNGPNTRLHVDHCHKTGEVRGALCGRCNLTLGHVEENPEILAAMVHYLGYVY